VDVGQVAQVVVANASRLTFRALNSVAVLEAARTQVFRTIAIDNYLVTNSAGKCSLNVENDVL